LRRLFVEESAPALTPGETTGGPRKTGETMTKSVGRAHQFGYTTNTCCALYVGDVVIFGGGACVAGGGACVIGGGGRAAETASGSRF